MIDNTYDIVVIGGGIAGSLCAVSAGRMGSSVLLVEECGSLGGSLVNSGTGPMMTFHAGKKQVIKGITDELIQRLVKKNLSVGHIVDSTGYTYTVTPFDSEGMKRELELMALEANVTILYHTMLSSVTKNEGEITSVDLLSCGIHFSVSAKIFVDASGDGDLIMNAGIPFRCGRDSDGLNQPMTMNFKLSCVDIDMIRSLMDRDVSLFPFLKDKPGIQHVAERLSCSGFQNIMKRGIKDGKISFDRDIVLFFETNTRNEVIVNMSRINGFNPVDPIAISKAEVEGRRQVWELYDFMKKEIPGFSNAKLIGSGPNIGVRSSRRMIGIYTVTVADILNQRRFDDSIACCGYPVDIHSSDGAKTDSTFLPYGTYYTVPLRCLINSVVPNVIATGRLVSCSFEAHASMRVSPCCGAMGHAAGVLASLCVQNHQVPGNLEYGKVRNRLLDEGAFLG
ncbi:MAG: FAD-dependent oxidoreductase [Sphaerochaetaceae bacterium]